MKIDGLGNIHNFKKLDGAKAYEQSKKKEPDKADAADNVELSNKAKALSALNNVPAVRADKVESIKKEIAKGDYLTDEKLDGAIQGLLDEIA